MGYQKLIYGVTKNGKVFNEYFTLEAGHLWYAAGVLSDFREALVHFMPSNEEFDALLTALQEHPDGQWYLHDGEKLPQCQFTIDTGDYAVVSAKIARAKKGREYRNKLHELMDQCGMSPEKLDRDYELIKELLEVNRAYREIV